MTSPANPGGGLGWAPPSGPPDPPPGPGVQPPFVAAPIEGRGARLGISLGVAGGLLLACCGVGGVAVGGLLLLGEQAINEQAQRAVDDYLSAVSAQQWQEAYEQRCAADRAVESLSEFTDRVSEGPQIDDYSVGDLQFGQGEGPFGADAEMAVPVEIWYADGTDTVLEVSVDQNPQTGQFEVCGATEA